MCVMQPVEVVTADGQTACALWHGQRLTIDTSLVAAVSPGERLLVYAGFALERVSAEDADAIEAFADAWDGAIGALSAGKGAPPDE